MVYYDYMRKKVYKYIVSLSKIEAWKERLKWTAKSFKCSISVGQSEISRKALILRLEQICQELLNPQYVLSQVPVNTKCSCGYVKGFLKQQRFTFISGMENPGLTRSNVLTLQICTRREWGVSSKVGLFSINCSWEKKKKWKCRCVCK